MLGRQDIRGCSGKGRWAQERKKGRTEKLVAQPTDSRTRRHRHDSRSHAPAQALPAISLLDDAQRLGHAAGVSYSRVGRGAASLEKGLVEGQL